MAMAICAQPISTRVLWKRSQNRAQPKSYHTSFLSQFSPTQHSHRVPTSSISSLGLKTRCYQPITMSLQMNEAQKTQSKLSELDQPTAIEITIRPETLVDFAEDYAKESAAWAQDLATTTDHQKIEEFVISAHALARRWLPREVISQLECYGNDPNQPPVLVIRGLPIDKDLPPTGPDVHLAKAGRCMSETWLVGIGRIVGQVFTFEFLRGSRGGMGLLVREIYTTAEKLDQVSAEGSRELLDFHVDFFQVRPECFPTIIAFVGIRGDRQKEGKTLYCDFRKLYAALDPSDIQILRTQEITWKLPAGPTFSKPVIEGSESRPRFNIFEENLPYLGGIDKVVSGSPEAIYAYKRVKEIAQTLAEGVWLHGGDLLLLHQAKALHGRSPYVAKYDGNDRWLQRTYINKGGFWETGLTQWPSRTLPSSST